jgi:hypothetical protein
MPDPVFVDSNILVYAHDRGDDPERGLPAWTGDRGHFHSQSVAVTPDGEPAATDRPRTTSPGLDKNG